MATFRYIEVTLGTDADGKTWTWATLAAAASAGEEYSGQTLPSFTNAPLVRPFPRGDRRVVVKNVDTDGFDTEIGSEGDDSLPITCDFEIVNLDTVTGPTPSTDFTSNRPEPLCTPMDVLMEHDLITPVVMTLYQLQIKCDLTRKMIDALSKYYSETNLKTDPYASPVVPAALWYDRDGEYDNRGASLAADSLNRSGCYGITVDDDNTTVYTQMYTITFTSATAFTIEGVIEGDVGSGNTSSDFTAGNGDFSISSDAWFGSFEKDNKFFFSLYTWYPMVHRLAIAAATAMTLWPIYGKDNGQGVVSTAGGYFREHMDGMKMLLNPDKKGGMWLPSLSQRTMHVKAKPYDISWLGINATLLTDLNKDNAGYRGESDSFYAQANPDFYYY